MGTELNARLRSGAWYGDRELDLAFPPSWTVDVYRPATPASLDCDDLARAIEQPLEQRPIRELARGRRRPLVVVDDLTRPTPANLIMSLIIRQLAEAGIDRSEVRVLLGTGAHGPAPLQAVARKAGPEAAAYCRLLTHDATRNCVRIGTTSFGTPVAVDREVAASDLVIGIGGVYPQHSVGFGGGSKIVLGTLGRRTIVGLHYGHPSVVGTYDVRNDFRRDLDEMARLIGLRTLVTLHVDADRCPVRAVSGDPFAQYDQAVVFSRTRYRAPLPGAADIVVANAYPMDVSLTFARSKGLAPLAHAAPQASRVLIAGCPEGLGYHALFPFMNGPRYERQRHKLRQLSVIRPAELPAKVVRRGLRVVRRSMGRSSSPRVVQAHAGQVRCGEHPIWLLAPQLRESALPARLPGMRVASTWEEVLAGVWAEQGGRGGLRVAVYSCAPLQCLDLDGAE